MARSQTDSTKPEAKSEGMGWVRFAIWLGALLILLAGVDLARSALRLIRPVKESEIVSSSGDIVRPLRATTRLQRVDLTVQGPHRKVASVRSEAPQPPRPAGASASPEGAGSAEEERRVLQRLETSGELQAISQQQCDALHTLDGRPHADTTPGQRLSAAEIEAIRRERLIIR